jgi:hypothetical protein
VPGIAGQSFKRVYGNKEVSEWYVSSLVTDAISIVVYLLSEHTCEDIIDLCISCIVFRFNE